MGTDVGFDVGFEVGVVIDSTEKVMGSVLLGKLPTYLVFEE